ncbi:MAG TPA: nucleotide exchange factor GrpE [Acidimicrobiales bacterium]|nr:nucleotide exchange factor GrpE [Acidimicrobiales bacterium]
MTSRPDRRFPAPPDEGEAEEVGGELEPPGGQPDALAETQAEEQSLVEEAVEEILTDVAALTAERDEYLNALQRSQADFANYRKRVLRQQEEQGNRAATELVTRLLPVLDTLDLAVAHLDKAEADGEPTTEGEVLRQARSQLLDTLGKEGLERVDEPGVPFDPAVHDAVAHAPDEEGAEAGGSRIDEVLRAGYRWRGQTLRAAMVRVRG